MIKMIPQPIVDLRTGKKVMEEWLCRPQGMTLDEYFNVLDISMLWEREARCIQEAIKQKSDTPKMINITLSSIPYFLETNWTWVGGIEVVEYGPRQYDMFRILPLMISRLKERGLLVWVDDLTPDRWLQWKFQKVDGYKMSWQDIEARKGISDFFIKEVKSRSKPIVMEWIENKEVEMQAKKLKMDYGQGFFYDDNYFANKGKKLLNHTL